MDGILIVLLILFVGFILVRSGVFVNKGERGERIVGAKLSSLPPDYIIMNDVYLKRPDGKTSQIDHIVISQCGIFVIETKNYSGKIYGSENAEYWKEYFSWFSRSVFKYGHHSKEFPFFNPIRQNQGHINTLRKLLSQYGTLPFFSIIVFSNNAELHLTVSSADVTHWSNLEDVILSHKDILLTEEQVSSIIHTISMHRRDGSGEIASEHAARAQEAKATSYSFINEGKCPRCGGNLVLRNGRYGRFYGCSNYPRCKFTLNT